MTTYYTRRTPDYSPYVVHLVRDRRFSSSGLITEDHPLYEHRDTTAVERLTNILELKRIYGTPLPFVNNHPGAVCFTECIWLGLVEHTRAYSSYGLVFSKKAIFERDGGPALYIRGDILSTLGVETPDALLPFIAPFDPEGIGNPGHIIMNYLHEREWRLPGNFDFDYSDVEYVIVNSVDDVNLVASQIGLQYIPKRKYIAMETYKVIQEAWKASP